MNFALFTFYFRDVLKNSTFKINFLPAYQRRDDIVSIYYKNLG